MAGISFIILCGQESMHFPQPLQRLLTTAVLFFIDNAPRGQDFMQSQNPAQINLQLYSVSKAEKNKAQFLGPL